MKKMTILFPGSYMNYHVIDDDMSEELQAAGKTELFNTVLFNYDDWLAGDKLKLTDHGNVSNPVIYRGWMLKPEEYQRLYEELEANGIYLLTKPEAYSNMHLFQNVYPLIKDDAAKMIYFPDRKVDLETVKRHFNRFMVKDSVKSAKGTEFPTYFDQSTSQAEFDEAMKTFYKYRGNLLTGGICVKEYLDLKRYDGVTNEFRVFYANGKIISVSKNSKQPESVNKLPMELAEKYLGLNSPYYTIDYAELADGSWKIIEAGDGSVSGLSAGQDAVEYYQAIYHAFVELVD